MLRFARIFQDKMILQRNIPVLFYGTNDGQAVDGVSLKLNGEELDSIEIPSGEFTFYFPEQDAMEDATISVGAVSFHHVDFGEVWIAGGQSNMEFALEYDRDGDKVIAEANDPHLRMYTVGQYSYAGQREEGYKAWNPWDEWLPFCSKNAGRMSAVGIYFARELRARGVPVGIVSCNWGGTSASSWMSRECMLEDEQVSQYVTEYDAMVAKLDLDRYNMIKKITRPGMCSPASRQVMGFMMKNTMKPEELMQAMATESAKVTKMQGKEEQMPEEQMQALEFMKDVSQAEMMMPGPGDEHEPAALYENMLTEIIGFSNRGVLWYQGESDAGKADYYDRTFMQMIHFWREQWKEKNPYQEKLPFLYVQIAPFGTWMGNDGTNYPLVRQAQEKVAREVADVYMTSVSDLGNVYDIHPKVKGPVGFRLYLLAARYVYGDAVLADAPEAAFMERQGNVLLIHFRNGQGLYGVKNDDKSYNGFALEDIPEHMLPPVLGGINGLQLTLDGEVLEDAMCRIAGDMIEIVSPKLKTAQRIQVDFAKTGFYQVNVYNMAGIPVKPFTLRN